MALELTGTPVLEMKSPWPKGPPDMVGPPKEVYGDLTLVIRVGMDDQDEARALLELLGWTAPDGLIIDGPDA